MENLVTITVCNSRIEAEIIKGKLEANEIAAIIFADDAGGMYPFPNQAGFSGVAVMVSKKDFLKAKKLLKSTG